MKALSLFALLTLLAGLSVGQVNQNLQPPTIDSHILKLELTGFGTSVVKGQPADLEQLLMSHGELNIQNISWAGNDQCLITYGEPKNHDELIIYLVRQFGCGVEVVE